MPPSNTCEDSTYYGLWFSWSIATWSKGKCSKNTNQKVRSFRDSHIWSDLHTAVPSAVNRAHYPASLAGTLSISILKFGLAKLVFTGEHHYCWFIRKIPLQLVKTRQSHSQNMIRLFFEGFKITQTVSLSDDDTLDTCFFCASWSDFYQKLTVVVELDETAWENLFSYKMFNNFWFRKSSELSFSLDELPMSRFDSENFSSQLFQNKELQSKTLISNSPRLVHPTQLRL